jgi:hypothetical protein
MPEDPHPDACTCSVHKAVDSAQESLILLIYLFVWSIPFWPFISTHFVLPPFLRGLW